VRTIKSLEPNSARTGTAARNRPRRFLSLSCSSCSGGSSATARLHKRRGDFRDTSGQARTGPRPREGGGRVRIMDRRSATMAERRISAKRVHDRRAEFVPSSPPTVHSRLRPSARKFPFRIQRADRPWRKVTARAGTPPSANGRFRRAEYRRIAATPLRARRCVVDVASLFGVRDLFLYPVPLTRPYNTPGLSPQCSIFRKPASHLRQKRRGRERERERGWRMRSSCFASRAADSRSVLGRDCGSDVTRLANEEVK